MGIFDLTNLMPWTRRAGGDALRRERETVISDGTTRAFLSSGNHVDVESIELDNIPMASGTYTVEGNMVRFGTAPDENSELFVTYDYARYTDEQITQFLSDAARIVESDLGIRWDVHETVGVIYDATDLIVDVDGRWIDAYGEPDATIEKLVVLRAAMSIYEEKNAQASDDAITVRDGTTMIDTSKAAHSSSKVLERLAKDYRVNMMAAKRQRFSGESIAFDRGWDT